jgi:hypothetical protein
MERLKEAETLIGDYKSFNKWCLSPRPVSRLKRTEFEAAVKKARVQMIHDKWEDALEAARELSDTGGIESVTIVRIVHTVHLNATFRDGKQVAKQ